MIRVLFLWSQSLLDWRSGAAIDVRTALEVLAQTGVFECRALGMTLFDGAREFPLERWQRLPAADTPAQAPTFEIERRGVRHELLRTASTLADRADPGESARFLAHAAARVSAYRPDIVVTTGGGALARSLHAVAAESRARRAFYLANPGYVRGEVFDGFDRVWTPTRAMARRYRARFGIRCDLFPTVFGTDSFLDMPADEARTPARPGWITFVNPAPEKGALLFFRLARLAARERPDLRFAVVEGRAARSRWGEEAALPNILWLRERRDMRPVYRRTALLLFPSLCFEAAGRVPVEAQLSGIPVLATDRGGIPEQLNGAGFLFPAPPRCVERPLLMPPEGAVRPWLDCIVRLLDDPGIHARASRAARAAAEPFHPRRRHPEVVRAFGELART